TPSHHILITIFIILTASNYPYLHSFPTRRSSDLEQAAKSAAHRNARARATSGGRGLGLAGARRIRAGRDRESDAGAYRYRAGAALDGDRPRAFLDLHSYRTPSGDRELRRARSAGGHCERCRACGRASGGGSGEVMLAIEVGDLLEAAGRLPMHGGTTGGALPGHPFFGAGFLFVGSLMVVELLAGGVWSRAYWRRMLWPGALLMASAGMLLVSYFQTDSKSLHLTLAMLLLLGAYTEAQYRLVKIWRL